MFDLHIRSGSGIIRTQNPCVRWTGVLEHLSSVSQHGVFGFGQLLSADDLQHQLLLHASRYGVLQVGVEGT